MGHIWSIVYIWCWDMYIEEIYIEDIVYTWCQDRYLEEVYIEDIVCIWCWDMYLEEEYRGHSLHMVLGHVSRGDI